MLKEMFSGRGKASSKNPPSQNKYLDTEILNEHV